MLCRRGFYGSTARSSPARRPQRERDDTDRETAIATERETEIVTDRQTDRQRQGGRVSPQR